MAVEPQPAKPAHDHPPPPPASKEAKDNGRQDAPHPALAVLKPALDEKELAEVKAALEAAARARKDREGMKPGPSHALAELAMKLAPRLNADQLAVLNAAVTEAIDAEGRD